MNRSLEPQDPFFLPSLGLTSPLYPSLEPRVPRPSLELLTAELLPSQLGVAELSPSQF